MKQQCNFHTNMLRFIVYFLAMISLSKSQTYQDTLNIFNEKLGSSVYNPDIRPVLKQADVIYVGVEFSILAIEEVNDISQTFKCNGLAVFYWTDELLRWNVSEYGGYQVLHPKPAQIWRPRVVMLNTLDDRDIFEDDYAPVNVFPDGTVTWAPGSLFSASCKLDLTYFPFDLQICRIELASMHHSSDELAYYSLPGRTSTTFFYPNGEWALLRVNTSVSSITAERNSTRQTPTLEFIFYLKRRPMFHVISTILPVVLLSSLNLLVFWIPVESGEKISYGITVLLALAVFLSIVSGMLPSSSESFPYVTIYLFILLIISALTVVASIVIIYFHHKEEKGAEHLKAKSNFKSALSQITRARLAIAKVDGRVSQNGSETGHHAIRLSSRPMSPQGLHATSLRTTSSEDVQSRFDKASNEREDKNRSEVNKFKLIGEHINAVCFIIFLITWVAVTIGFLVSLTTGEQDISLS